MRRIISALSTLGLTIQDARTSSTPDGWALDTFTVLEQNGCFVDDHYRLQEIREQLLRIIGNPPADGFAVTRRSSRQARVFHTAPQIHFRDDPGPHTAMELVATDRPGLLSCVGQVFARHGIRVHAAKIATIGARAEDVFWITDTTGRIDDTALRARLSLALIEALNDATD